MQLVIVESPTKSKTLQKFLGPKYRVLSSYGHIRDLPQSELGVSVEQDFTPKYVIPPKSRKTITLLKKESLAAESTILATDEDREGEAIAWHLFQALGLGKYQAPNRKPQPNSKPQIAKPKPYQRIVFHEITKAAIEEAVKNPRDIDMNLVDAQQARRILDRIVGYKLSPFLWKKIARGLSAGRVQSAALRLVAEREKEIEKFTPQEYWSIEALLKKNGNGAAKSALEFTATLIKKNSETIDKLAIKNQKGTDEIVNDLSGAEYRVTNFEKKEVKKNPPPPFTTSTLQQESFKRFRFPAKLTMQTAQALYEKGFITYHRTDSLNLSDQSLFAAKKFIETYHGTDYWAGFPRRYKTKSKNAQEAHEAIRPAYADGVPEKIKNKAKLDANQFRLYDLIWRRFIACQMAEAVFDAAIVDISAKDYTFRATGQTLKFDGFLRAYPIKFEEIELPILEKEELVELIKLIPSQHFTQPPPRYTEASLIKTLEQNGIGRPSTYAPILSTIQERNYIEKNEQKRFRPTEIGVVVNDLLVEHFPKIVDLEFTAKMEENLDDIAQGKKQWVPIIRDFYEPFAEQLEQKYQNVSKKEFTESPTDKNCQKCDSPLIIRLGRFGKFYACSAFPKCNYTEALEKNSLDVNCPKCETGKIVEKRTKRKKIFYGCNKYPDCDFALWDQPTGEKCPKCQSLMVKTKRNLIKCSSKECVPS